MKKIGIDARLYSQTGVGVYLKNFLYYLEKKDIKNELYYVYLMPDDYNKVSFKNKNIIKRLANYRWHGVNEQFGFAVRLYLDNLDLMHFTYFSYPVLYFRKFISTVHDVTLLKFKTGKASTKSEFIYNIKHFIFEKVLNQQVNRSIKIITPTYTVKKQLEDIYGKEISKKIHPVYEGISYQILESKENKEPGRRFGNFFVYVGNFYPHKNIEKLIQAFSSTETPAKLLLLGPNDFFQNRLFQLINRLKQEKRILFINNPSVPDMVFFYKNALALIHASLSEGFGLPIVEAAHFGCPIIASDIPVFKELLADNYLFFDPRSAADISLKINQFLNNKPKFDYRKILDRYSFEKMTDKTVKIYKNILYHEKSNNQESRHRL